MCPPFFVPNNPAAPKTGAAIQPVARRDSVSHRVPWNIPTSATPKAHRMHKRCETIQIIVKSYCSVLELGSVILQNSK
jgi:hypothetical protein